MKKNSLILKNVTDIRNMISSGEYKYPKLDCNEEVLRLHPGDELQEQIEKSYSTFGIEDTIIICKSNKRAYLYNQQVRHKILWKEERISNGDYLMVVRNNYTWLDEESKAGFIANKTAILTASGHPNPRQEANRMWTDMIIKGIEQDQFPEQSIEYLLYQDKFVAEQHKGTGKLSSYYDIQPKNANRIAQAFIERNAKNNRDSELKRIQDLEKRLLDGQKVPQDILTTFTNEDLRTKAEQLLAAGEVREFDRPEFLVEQELFKKVSADRANLINPKKFSNDPQWRDQTSANIYDQAGDFFKKKYQERFDISGDRGDALEKAREATLAALNNGQFDNVISEIIEDLNSLSNLSN